MSDFNTLTTGPLNADTLGLERALSRFAGRCATQAALAAEYLDFLQLGPATFTRSYREGHFTGSAFVVSTDGERCLLLHHAKLDRWLQPGGHADGDMDLAAVALREAEEETNLIGLLVETDIFDLDRHGIPARGDEPEHQHWDVRYVVRCADDETPRINAESRAFAWHRIRDIAVDPTFDASIRRMASRWLAREARDSGSA